MNWKSAAILAIATLTFVGCGSGNFSKKQSAGEADTLRYPIPNNPTSLDYALVQDGDTLDMLQQVYEGLVGWAPIMKWSGC
ncbi:hypothetical protein QPK87_17635 [Kamptonema cortianum]|nr:hypothetical protein [Kamptonema cortianum]